MRATTTQLSPANPFHSYAGRILRVNLSTMAIRAIDSRAYLPDFLGARGLATAMCWDECPEPVDPFAPANPLIVAPGATSGSRAPYSGRTNVCAFAPQAQPYPWFTRSSIGGSFGATLKRAGYDALVVVGSAESPVRLRIRDNEVTILPADDLWGLDMLDALDAVKDAEGRGAQVLTIGPAGEHLSRIATIQTGSSSACGEGGFGAVMGSKKLKAISVAGTGRVAVAHPETLTSLSRVLAKTLRPGTMVDRDMDAFNADLEAQGGGSARVVGCTEGCLTPCALEYHDMPAVTQKRTWSGLWFCFANRTRGVDASAAAHVRAVYPWQLDTHAAFEVNHLANRYGLNLFELLSGLVPWLCACQREGLLDTFNGETMDWRDPAFWARFLHALAYRVGDGDTLADGGWLAAQRLGIGQDVAQAMYPGWGYSNHHDGHQQWGQWFPFWLPMTLQWMTDTRNPIPAGHGSLRLGMFAQRAWAADTPDERQALLDMGARWSEAIYGDPDATDPHSGYRAKACVGHWHTLRSVIKDCVPVDDLCFPWVQPYDEGWQLADAPPTMRGIEGLGDVPGTSIEYHILRTVSGLDWDEPEFERAARRVATLERALQVRHWGRNRATDELALPYFEQAESCPNPFLGDQRIGLGREQFAPTLTEFYALHGWDEDGRPTRETMDALGLGDRDEAMRAGAERAD